MPGDGTYKPRLSVEITEEQYKRLQKFVPWGLQKHLFGVIVDDLLDLLERGDSEKIIAAIIAQMIRPRDLLKSLKE